MTETYVSRRILVIALALTSMGISLHLPSQLLGQATPQLIRVRVDEGKDPLVPVNLRPNTPTTVGIFLQNPGKENLSNLTVKLVQLVEADVKVIAQTSVAKLPSKGEARLVFPKGKEAPKKPAKEGAKEAPKDGMEFLEAPFKFQLWIESQQKDDLPLIKRDLDLVIREPRDYIASVAQFDKSKNRLSFKVELEENERLIGPHKCPVLLVLGPEMEESKNGAYKQILTGSRQIVELFAEDVALATTKIREGRAYLTVDGYERAFTYPVTMAGTGRIDEMSFNKKIGARIRVPRYTKPNAKFPVLVELDGPLNADYRVEIGLDRAGKKERFLDEKFVGLRQQKIGLGFSEAGDLVCHTQVRDWQAEFDTTGLYGNIWFRLVVFKKDRKTGKYEEAELSFPEETRPYLAQMISDVESKRLYAGVIQDDTPPEEVRFVDLPATWVAGKPLPVHVKIRKREEHQAPIEKVLFFKGKIPADGKFNPDMILGAGELDAKSGQWLGVLPAQEKNEALDFTALVTTLTGEKAVKSATVVFKKLARIKGKVLHGALAQANLAVTLSDPKGNVLGGAKTKAKGEFEFDSVAPGIYVVSAVMPFPALVGSIKVEVPEGKDPVEVTVRLLAK